MPAPKSPYQPYADVHVEPKGAGDARPTAFQIIEKENLVGDKLEGKVFLVTGCSAGIGIETARSLHATGADVFMTVREGKKDLGEKIRQDILSKSPGKGKLELVFIDLTSFANIRAGAKNLLSRTKTLNVVVFNAAIMLCPKGTTEEGFELTIGTNHFGHFLLFQLLKDRLLASATPAFSSRVVAVSSAGHRYSPIHFDDINYERRDYNPMEAYGQSKIANVYMANSIERHYGSKHLHATSLHPGVILTSELSRHVDAEWLSNAFDMAKFQPIAKSLEQGAATQVWAATASYFNDKGGVYLSDCGEGAHMEVEPIPGSPGYASHAYDEEAEEKLWRLSCDAVGVAYD